MQGQEPNITRLFQRYGNEKLTPHFNEDFTQVTFSFEREMERTQHVKISKGEESNFVWSIFHGLLEQVVRVMNNPDEEEDYRELQSARICVH